MATAAATGLRVRIIGGGLAGLGAAARFAESSLVSSLQVYDSSPGPGVGGASAVSALMHPFATRGKLIWRGEEGMRATSELLLAAEKHKPGAFTTLPLLRPCYTEPELEQWTRAAEQRPGLLRVVSAAYIAARTGETAQIGGVCCDSAVAVDAGRYLSGLWAEVGARLSERGGVAGWEQLDANAEPADVAALAADCDVCLVAAGAGSAALWAQVDPAGAALLPFTYVRGQQLVYPAPPPCELGAVLHGEYVVRVGDLLVCGATHEFRAGSHKPAAAGDQSAAWGSALASEPADQVVAEAVLRERAFHLYPALQSMQPAAAQVGVRVSTERASRGRLPLVLEAPRNPGACGACMLMLAGFGSRGLIHHAVVGRLVADYALRLGLDATPLPLPEELQLGRR